MSEYNYDENLISDLHKDARGYRPREGFWQEWDTLTAAGRQDIWDGLLRELDRAIEDQRAAEERHLVKFRATLKRVMESQRVDWRTAMRWLMQADDEQDIDHWLWKQGLSYEKSGEIQRLYRQSAAA